MNIFALTDFWATLYLAVTFFKFSTLTFTMYYTYRNTYMTNNCFFILQHILSRHHLFKLTDN